MKTLADIIQILAEADLRNGVDRERLRLDIDKYAEEERYEICEGLQRALKSKLK